MSEGPALQLQGVGKSYGFRTRKPALHSVSLRVERGECYGLAGQNGAGKTTLIRILLGLAAPDEGEVRLLGTRPDDPEVRRRVGFVPESAELPQAGSPRALVRRWARLRGLARGPAEEQGLRNLERLGMGALLDRPSGRLSKGEKQRTLLALALLGQPELLVLDEPTDGLDPLGRALMREVIREECAAGRTVFLNSHLLAETERICTRVGILHQGRLVREERIAHRADGDAGVTAVALASPPSAELLSSSGLRLAELVPVALREGAEPRPTVLIDHADLPQLNLALDKLRSAGALLVEVRRVRADLEVALAEVVQGAPAGLGDASAPLEDVPSLPPRPLRALGASLRVAAEIAADLASRKVGWMALAAAFIAIGSFLYGVRGDLAQGAAATAQHFGRGGGIIDERNVASFVGTMAANFLFWSTLSTGIAVASVFAPPLLDPRRLVLLLAQPLSRGDYATGIAGAVCSMALGVCAFCTGLLFFGLRFLGIGVSWRFLLLPLPWIAAFASIYVAQLASTYAVRNAFFAGLTGLGLFILATTIGHSEAARPGMGVSTLGVLYGLLPRTVELGNQAGHCGEGGRLSLLPFLSTLVTTAALLLVLLFAARRSER